jgi:carboxypeptidase C (cathepsin A)
MNTPNTPTDAKNPMVPAALGTGTVEPKQVQTHHKIKIGKTELAYTATVGTMPIREESSKDGNTEGNKPKAELFYTSYTLDRVKDKAKRPISFVFNGGPGSSSVWLHLGLFGPKIVAKDDFGNAPPPPYALKDNPLTLLAQSDLVFIDPIGTGFSRMLDGEKTSEFHDYQRDLDSVGEFIRAHLSAQGRWASPKFIIGESYGTTRACGLAAHLQDKYQLNLNGLVLISCALDFSTLRFGEGNDLPYPLFLPTYTAAAWFHKKLPAQLQKLPLEKAVAASEAFAATDYSAALFHGARLDAKAYKTIAARVAEFAGLSAQYVERSNLRVSAPRYFKELLRDDGKVIGRFDVRFTGLDRDDAGEIMEEDAAGSNIMGAYGAQANAYLRETLGWKTDLHYTLLGKLYLSWKWGSFEGRYPNVGEALRRAMHHNPHMRVFVANGYYDLATPHYAAEHTLAHAITRPEMLGRIQTEYFHAGHMMYIQKTDFEKLAKDLLKFVAA